MKSFAFQKRSKEILLHQRANHADRKQWPQKINMSVMTSQYEIAAKITLILSQNVFLQRCNLPARERKIIGTSSMLTCGKSRVFPTASFLHLNDFFFFIQFLFMFLYSYSYPFPVDDGVVMSPERRNYILLLRTCLCFNKSVQTETQKQICLDQN